MGYRQIGIEYEPGIRTEGKSKYTVKKMIRFALQGITSFSTKPLYIAVYLGFVFSLVALLYIPYILYSFYFGHTISGWSSIIVTIAFFSGLQLMILGIIGIYIGKLFMQSKQRPHYIVKESNQYDEPICALSFDVEEFDMPLEYGFPISGQNRCWQVKRLDAIQPI